MFDDIGITSRQLSLLVAVAENPGASQRQLSQAVTLDVNTVSDTLRRMERKSLIFRNASANDGRSVTVTLTEQGREILETAVSRNAMFQEMISEQLQPDETDQLKTLINKMLQ
nr:MarR family transcriptional regulator [Pseudooceanicola sp. HF7]